MYIDAIQTLHISACDDLGLGEHTKHDIEILLQDLRSMLEGVGMLRELTARCVVCCWFLLEAPPKNVCAGAVYVRSLRCAMQTNTHQNYTPNRNIIDTVEFSFWLID